MAMKTSRLTKAVLAAVLGLSLSGGGLTTTYASDADAELAALELELATLEAELAQEKGTIKEEKTKLAKEPNKMKLSGDARVKYAYAGNGARWYYRGRLAVQHDINEKVSVNVRWGLMNDNPMGLSEHFAHKINTNYPNTEYVQLMYPDLTATDGSWVSDANLQVKKFLGADKVTIGRFGQTFGATGLMGDEDAFGGIDGIKFDWSGKAGSLTVGYAKFGALQQVPNLNRWGTVGNNAMAKGFSAAGGAIGYGELQRKAVETALFVNGKLNLGPAVTLHGMWLKEMNNGKTKLVETDALYHPYFWDNPNDHDYRGIGISAQIAPNLTLRGDYILNMNENTAYLADNVFMKKIQEGKNPNASNKALIAAKTSYKQFNFPRQKSEYISLRYKGAKWGDKGSFGINLDWRNIDPSARLDAYFTYTDNISSTDISNDYYISRSSMYNTLSVADDILASEGIRGPVIGFNYMITKNIKLSILQTFAGSYNYYSLGTSHLVSTRYKSGSKWYNDHTFNATYDKINEKADNMTVIAITAKF